MATERLSTRPPLTRVTDNTRPDVVILAALFCLLPFEVNAQQAREVDLSRISWLELPTHGLLAAGSGESGTVEAEFYIDKKGEVLELTFRTSACNSAGPTI
jgi:hypothetical protein